jgi:hypothetical protein
MGTMCLKELRLFQSVILYKCSIVWSQNQLSLSKIPENYSFSASNYFGLVEIQIILKVI